MFRRKNKRRSSSFSVPEITLTPLIDTALTLLIIFMVSSPLMRMTIRVELPESSTATKTDSFDKDEPLVVDVDNAGKLFFGGMPVTLDQLKEKISRITRSNPSNNIVYINGDKSLKYQEIVKLIDTINTIEGIRHVALVTQKHNC